MLGPWVDKLSVIFKKHLNNLNSFIYLMRGNTSLFFRAIAIGITMLFISITTTFCYDIKIERVFLNQTPYSAGSNISGFVEIKSVNSFVPQGYLLLRIDKVEDNTLPYRSLGAIAYKYIYNVTIFPNATIKIPFTIKLPKHIPSGSYLLYVFLNEKTTKQVDYTYKYFSVMNGDAAIKYPISFRVYDSPRRRYETPAVLPDEELTAEVNITSLKSQSLKVCVRVFDPFDYLGSNNVVTKSCKMEFFAANSTKTLLINFKSPKDPGSYFTEVVIYKDDEPILYEGTYIHVDGICGKINGFSINKPAFLENESIIIKYDIDGPFSPINIRAEADQYNYTPFNSSVPQQIEYVLKITFIANNATVKEIDRRISINPYLDPTSSDTITLKAPTMLYKYIVKVELLKENDVLDTLEFAVNAPKPKVPEKEVSKKPIPEKHPPTEIPEVPKEEKLKIPFYIIVLVVICVILGVIFYLFRVKK